MTREERTVKLAEAVTGGDASARAALLAELEEKIPPERTSFIDERVAGWLATFPREGNEVPDWEHFEKVVTSNVRDYDLSQAQSKEDLAAKAMNLLPQIRQMCRVHPQFREELALTVISKAVLAYKPTGGGTFLGLCRAIVKSLARSYDNFGQHAELDENRDGEVILVPPPECFDFLLYGVAHQEPHKALVFLLSLCGLKPREIDAQFGSNTLEQILERVEEMYFARPWNSPPARQAFRKLRDGIPVEIGVTLLNSWYGRPAQDDLPAWKFQVWKSIRCRLVSQQAALLDLVFSLGLEPHKLLTFAYMALLCWLPKELWMRRQDRLSELKDGFLKQYPDRLDRKRLDKSTGPLTIQIHRAGNPRLVDYASDQTHLSYWRSEVMNEVKTTADAEELCVIAYINGIALGRARIVAKKGGQA